MSGWDSDYRYEPAPLFEHIFRCALPRDEGGNRIVMPLSSLHLVETRPVKFPLFFKIEGFNSDKVSYCGVLDFTAEEGFVHLPSCMMRNLGLEVCDDVVLRDASFSRGSYMKLRPHETAFVEVSDPKAVLEQALRGYACLSRGDTFMVRFNGRDYYLDVMEVRPGEAVSLIETDCLLEFAPALDYVEPPRREAARSDGGGGGDRYGGGHVKEGKKEVRPFAAAEEAKKDGGKEEFEAFSGKGRVLGGRFLGRAVASGGRAVVAGASYKAALVEGKKIEKDGGGKVAELKACGGRGGRVTGGPSSEAAAEEGGDGEKDDFKAFSGRGRVLGGSSLDAVVKSDGWSVPARAPARAVAVVEEEKKSKKDCGKEEAKEEFKAFSGKGRVLGGPILL